VSCLILLQAGNFIILNLSQQSRQKQLADIKDDKLEDLSIVNELIFNLKSINELYKIAVVLGDLYLLDESSKVVLGLKERLEEVKAKRQRVERNHQIQEHTLPLHEVESYLEQVGVVYRNYIKNSEDSDATKETFKIGQRYNQLIETLERFVTSTKESLGIAFEKFQTDSDRSYHLSNAIHIFSIVVLILFGMYVHRSIVGRLEILLDYLRRLKSNEETPLLKIRDDEIGEIETQIISIQQNLIAAKLAAETADKAKSNFLSNMNHELRTPLNGIMGMTQMIHESNLDAEQRQCVDIILRSSKHLMEVISDILEMSMLNIGKYDHSPESIAIAKVFDDIGKILHHTLQSEGKKLSLHFSIGETVPEYCWLDFKRLCQVLLCLIGNAIKFSKIGTIEVSASIVKVESSELLLRIAFEDEGIGIAPEGLSKLFEIFTQVDDSNTRTHGGTGLGLAICKASVSLMKGKMGVESQLNRGSTFWFEIPTHACEASDTLLS